MLGGFVHTIKLSIPALMLPLVAMRLLRDGVKSEIVSETKKKTELRIIYTEQERPVVFAIYEWIETKRTNYLPTKNYKPWKSSVTFAEMYSTAKSVLASTVQEIADRKRTSNENPLT